MHTGLFQITSKILLEGLPLQQLAQLPQMDYKTLSVGTNVQEITFESNCNRWTTVTLLKVKCDHIKAVFTAQRHASTVYATVVCLSVTSRCSTETAKHRIMQTMPHDSTGTLSFLMPKISAKLKWGHPQSRCQIQVEYIWSQVYHTLFAACLSWCSA